MTSEIADPLAGKAFFNTFGSDPYPVVQAALTIEIIEEDKLIENAKAMGAYLMEGLKGLMKSHSLIGDVRGRGLLMGMELVKDRTTKEHAVQETIDLMEACMEKGLLLGKGGLKGNVLRIAPPLTLNKSEVEFIVKTIDESLHLIAKK